MIQDDSRCFNVAISMNPDDPNKNVLRFELGQGGWKTTIDHQEYTTAIDFDIKGEGNAYFTTTTICPKCITRAYKMLEGSEY